MVDDDDYSDGDDDDDVAILNFLNRENDYFCATGRRSAIIHMELLILRQVFRFWARIGRQWAAVEMVMTDDERARDYTINATLCCYTHVATSTNSFFYY